jgi:SAM-dependent methyltransferase
LLYRVSGAANVEWFLLGGRWARESILEVLESAGLELRPGARVLDFGCGCGRVARHWLAAGNVELVGTDADREAVRWCRRHLSGGRFEENAAEPPLPLPANAFDLVYALSVFTHLPELRQHAWLDELWRVLVPGGLLALTLHGEAYLGDLDDAQREAFRAGELVVVGSEAPGSNHCNAFHPEPAVRELTRDWELLVWLPEGARGNPKQDLILLRKRAD